jgi:hypothetical protein
MARAMIRFPQVALAVLLLLLSISRLPAAETAPAARLQALEAELVTRYGEAQRERARRGLAQVAALWRDEDGDPDAFADFIREQFAGTPAAQDALFARFEHNLEMMELEIATEERVKHPEMSATAMKDHLKGACYGTKDWRDLRQEIVELVNKVDGLEYDRRIREKDIEIATARMNQMGGYLMYLGAVKLASTATHTA